MRLLDRQSFELIEQFEITLLKNEILVNGLPRNINRLPTSPLVKVTWVLRDLITLKSVLAKYPNASNQQLSRMFVYDEQLYVLDDGAGVKPLITDNERIKRVRVNSESRELRYMIVDELPNRIESKDANNTARERLELARHRAPGLSYPLCRVCGKQTDLSNEQVSVTNVYEEQPYWHWRCGFCEECWCKMQDDLRYAMKTVKHYRTKWRGFNRLISKDKKQEIMEALENKVRDSKTEERVFAKVGERFIIDAHCPEIYTRVIDAVPDDNFPHSDKFELIGGYYTCGKCYSIELAASKNGSSFSSGKVKEAIENVDDENRYEVICFSCGTTYAL